MLTRKVWMGLIFTWHNPTVVWTLINMLNLYSTGIQPLYTSLNHALSSLNYIWPSLNHTWPSIDQLRTILCFCILFFYNFGFVKHSYKFKVPVDISFVKPRIWYQNFYKTLIVILDNILNEEKHSKVVVQINFRYLLLREWHTRY